MRTRLALALVTAGLSLATADSAAAASRFFQFNMCGSVSGGECNSGRTSPVAGAIAASILDLKPHAVSLNEACRSQVRAVARRLRRAGRPMRFRWVQTNFHNSCPGDDFGNAVLTVNRITATGAWRLKRDPGEPVRTLLCVRTRLAGRRSRVCGTHIATASHRADQRRQIKEVTTRVSRYARSGTPVVLMGDFNVEPGDRLLNRLYRRFEEADQGRPPCRCGESTRGSRKIDYIFFSRRHWKRVGGNATRSEHSDHDPLRGWARRA
jgi:endonuclease/exonuclease/phosphatase family metal-dependent hydrolase